MAAIVGGAAKLLKSMFVNEMPADQRHPPQFCQAYLMQNDDSFATVPAQLPQVDHISCQPIVIETKSGDKIPPKGVTNAYVCPSSSVCDTLEFSPNCEIATQTSHINQTLESAPISLTATSGAKHNKIIQMPSNTDCRLLRPSGCASDSCLPEPILKIRRRMRAQLLRERQRRQLRQSTFRRCLHSPANTVTNTETAHLHSKDHASSPRKAAGIHSKDHASSPRKAAGIHSKDHTSSPRKAAGIHSKDHASSPRKAAGRRELGCLLRNGKRVTKARPVQRCSCCCCSRDFCHHRTHYMAGRRNTSCETITGK